jgi:hypothetical protein
LSDQSLGISGDPGNSGDAELLAFLLLFFEVFPEFGNFGILLVASALIKLLGDDQQKKEQDDCAHDDSQNKVLVRGRGGSDLGLLLFCIFCHD